MRLRQNALLKLQEWLQITGFEVYSSVLVIYRYQNNNKIKQTFKILKLHPNFGTRISSAPDMTDFSSRLSSLTAANYEMESVTVSCYYKHISLCLNMLQVAACHCRVHETYKRCFPSAAPLLPCKVTRLEEIVKPCRCELLNCLILHLLLSSSCSSYYVSYFALFSSPS
jgi:hypothetical protein